MDIFNVFVYLKMSFLVQVDKKPKENTDTFLGSVFHPFAKLAQDLFGHFDDLAAVDGFLVSQEDFIDVIVAN